MFINIKKCLKVSFRISIFILILASVSISVFAQTQPRLINFQGKLTDQQGQPLDGTYTVVFSLYATATGGTAIWTERHENLSISQGLVNALLGSIQSLDSPQRVEFDGPRYLGITIDVDNNANSADPEMLPRQRIIPAIHAYDADRAKHADISDYSTETKRLSGMQTGAGSTNATGETTITFTTPFESIPRVFVQANGSSEGIVLDVVSKSSNGFTVKARKITGIVSGSSAPSTNAVSAGTPSGSIGNTNLGSHYHTMSRAQTNNQSPATSPCGCCSDYSGLSPCSARTVQIWEAGIEKIIFGVDSTNLGSHGHSFSGSAMGTHSHTVDSHNHTVDAPEVIVNFDWLAISM